MNEELAREQLLAMLQPGDTVQTILRHVSRSGMTRAISPVFNGKDISYLVGPVVGYRLDRRHDGLKVEGCGMDMGFHLVYGLSRRLFQGWTCIGDRCPSNDHSNGDRDYTPHPHSDGGYALYQRWL